MTQKNASKHIPVRRVVNGLLAAAVALACLFTAALAVSPELRTAVLSFLRMEEREQVPNNCGASSQPDISQAEIGQLVKAQYIRLDSRRYGFSGDLLTDLTWSEDRRVLEDAQFWEIKDSELVPIKIDLQSRQMDVTWNGIRYQGELYWYVRDGALYVFHGTPCGADTQPEDQWYISTLPGNTDTLLLRVARGRQMEYTEYPLLYHLDTGEAEELLAGVDSGILEQSDGTIWSPTARRAFITGRGSAEFPNGREWLYDRDTETLTDVAELGGIGADTAVFVDDDTLILRSYGTCQDGTYQTIACWVYHISTGQAVQTLAESPYYRWQDEEPSGIYPFYGGSCMDIGPDGITHLIDLTTGERTLIENFTFHAEDEFMISPSADKVLYYATDPEADGLGITRLGVLDMSQSTFIAFDREGYEDLYEEGIGWSSNDQISISAYTQDRKTRYMILYQF